MEKNIGIEKHAGKVRKRIALFELIELMWSLFFCRLKEKDVILQKMHTVESDYKSQVSKLESDLEDQRAKNNVSRLLQ